MDAMMREEMTATTSDFIDASEIARLLELTTSSDVNHRKDTPAPFQLSKFSASTVVSQTTNPAHEKGISAKNYIIAEPELRSATLMGEMNASMDPVTPFTSGKFRLVPHQPQPQPQPGSTRCSADADAEAFHPQTPRSSLEAVRPATNCATPDDSGAEFRHSGSISNKGPMQQHFEKYMMANPWASGCQVYQPPYPTCSNPHAGPMNLKAANFKVVRETVYDTSVAVLIEMHTPDRVWRQWGSARMVNGDTVTALRAASDDATQRIANLQSRKSQARRTSDSHLVPALPWAAPSTKPSVSEAEGLHPATQAAQPFPDEGTQNTSSASGFTEPPSASADVKTSRNMEVLRSSSWTAAYPKQRNDHIKHALRKIRSASKALGASSAAPVNPRTTVLLPSRMKVLVVDRDPQHLKEVQEALGSSMTSIKFEVTVAEDGQDVIRLGIAQGIRYDLILMGEKLKHLNGSDAASVYRKYEAANCLPETLMILTTNNPSPPHAVFCQSCGIDGILEKPSMVTKNLAKDILTCFGWRLENGPHKPLGSFLCRTGKLVAEATDTKSSVRIKDTERFESSLFFGESNLEVFGRRRMGGGLTGHI